MGTGCSLPLPDLPTPNYMSIVISGVDTFILLYSGKNELDAVRTSIQQNWSKGIQLEKAEMNDPTNVSSPKAYSFKLLGSPFGLTTSKAEAIQVRRMCGAILQGLRNMGWQLLVSSDLSRSLDLSTWYFQQQFVQFDTQKILEVGLSSTDKLQIVDCPPNIFQVIKNIVSQTWVRGIQAESQIDQFTYEIKLHGNPWSFVDKAESCSSRFMIKEIVTELSKQQWHLYGNSNLKSTADTLFFRFDQNLPFGEQFMIISLNQTDRIRLIHCEDSLITLIENTIRQWWHLGIQEVFDERPFCYEIKLRGNPWWADGDDAVRSRVLIVHLMEKMASVGFFITTGVDVSRKLNDKSLLLFKRGQPLQTQFLCVSLNETDKIRLINAPQHMIELGRSLIANLWSMGLQEEKQLGDGVSYQAKLKGNPWSSVWRGDGIHGRALLVHILYHFTAYGWMRCRQGCPGAMGPSDDLSLLMPRIQQQAIHTTSENTAALREYVMVARGNAQPQPLAASNVPRRTRLALREGTGRVPQKRPFAIRVRVEELEQEQHKLHDDAVQLDPDELMEALLAQARQQRQVMLAQVLRLGTRQHVRRPFSIMLDPVVEPEPEPEPEPETVEQEEPEGDAAAAAATPGLHLLSAGRLLQAASSRLGQLRTPGSLLQGRYTPIEGVPERLLLTARPRQPSAAATASRSRLTAATPAGFTPMEGVPERLVSAQLLSGLRRCMGPGSSRMQSNGLAEHGGVDSPVEGLVQEGAHRGSAAQPVPADEFAFAAPAGGSGEGSELSDGRDDGPGAVDEPVPSARSPSGGFPLLAGAHSPARMADAGAQTGLSLKSQEQADRREAGTQAEASPPGMADAALQTGRSLRSPEKGEAGWAVAVAIDAAGGDAEPGEDPGTTVEDHNADGGFDDDDWDDDGAGDDGADAALEQPLQQPEASEAWEQADHWPEDQGQEDTAPSAERQPPKRRRTTLPGSRLRNELGKRKSLAIRSDMGRQEVAPGVRRSTRSREQPLKWWLNECKEYGREHTTLPTVKDVRHVKPNTPWRTVADPVASFRRKKARRAPTPQELELGVQPEGEDVEEEHEAQERQEEAMERGDEEAAAEGADGTEEGVKDEEREEQLQAGGGSDDEREREEEVDEEQPAARQVRHKQRSRQPKAAKKAAARAKRKGRR